MLQFNKEKKGKSSLSRADDSEEKVYKNVTVAGLSFYKTILATGWGRG